MDLSAFPTSVAMLVGSVVTAVLGLLGYRVTKRKTEIDSTAALVTLIRGINDELRKRVADLEAEVARLSGLQARRGRKVHETPRVGS